MKPVAVVMPFHGEARFSVASWIRLRFEALHPDWPLIIAADGGKPWSKPRAVNGAIPAKAEVVVVTDADVAVPAAALDWAVATVRGGAAWAVPFGTIYRLSLDRTARALHESPTGEVAALADSECVRHRPPYPAVPGGGIFAVARDAWETVGGFDERFEWGQEDASLGHALDTLGGPHEMLPAPLWHLFHQPRVQAPQMYLDQALEARFLALRGRPEGMRRLIAERTAGGPVEAVVVPRETGLTPA